MSAMTAPIYVTPDLKAKAERVYSAAGMDLSEAVNIFLRRSIDEPDFPLDLRPRVPNAVTQAALDELAAIKRGEIPRPPRMTVDEFFEYAKTWADDDE